MKKWILVLLSGVTLYYVLGGKAQADEKDDAAAAASIAKDKATAATAMQTADADLTKAQIANITAQQAYYQSLIPDASKFKIADPAAPKLNASASKQTYEMSSRVAARIANNVSSLVKDCKDGKPAISILPSDSSARALLTQSMSTQAVLVLAKKRLVNQRTLLKATVDSQPKDIELQKAAAPVVGIISDVVQLAASFALILKPSRAFDTINTQTIADSAFQSEVIGKLAANTCVKVHNPNAIVSVFTVPVPGAVDKNAPTELVLSAELSQEIEMSRDELRKASDKVVEFTKLANGEKNKDKKAALTAKVKLLTEQVSQFSSLIDECDKGLTALYVVDAQGNAPMDNAVRGGILRKSLENSSIYTLTLKTISSDADIMAKDCLFCSYKIMIGSTITVSWQLTDQSGKIKSSGADIENLPLAKIAIPD